MEIIRKNQAEKIKNNDVSDAFEYPSDDKDINGAVIELNGRYPDKGRVVNLECKELVYIIDGSGKVVVEGEEVKLNSGDILLIKPRERYFCEGNLKFLVSSTPAWNEGQYKKVD